MAHNSFLPILLTLLLCTGASAQEIVFERSSPPVTVAGRDLSLAWLGGLNAAQFQKIDLNGDGREDFLMFDRAGKVFVAALDLGSDLYDAAPELLVNFPTVNDWMAVRDYNLDGVPDIFTDDLTTSGIRVLRGSRGANGLLSFEQVAFGDPDPVLYFDFGNQRTSIFVTPGDYPSIIDIDMDGDLDVLSFNVLGGYIDFFKNTAVEDGLGADKLIFELVDRCWGGFFESGLSTELDLSEAPGECFVQGLLEGGGARHSGSTVLHLDYDGNGLMDVMLGDISYDQLTLGLNDGSPDLAWIARQDAEWQDNGVTARIPSFPAAFHLDVDNDGDKDLLGAPSITGSAAADIDVAWLYENVGSDAAPDFQFKTSRFLIDEMVDVGTMANVTTFDYDADGRVDLIVGNNNEYSGTNFFDSRLRLFRNVGEDDEIAFELIDEDYLGLSAFFNGTWAFAPTFGDMDGDGDEDAIVGVRNGTMAFIENTAGAGNPAVFAPPIFEWLGIDANQRSKPDIVDLDRDGLPDIVAGGADGRIRFFKNIGTATAPDFVASDREGENLVQLGMINTNAVGVSSGHPTPEVIQSADRTLIITGNRSGTLEAYEFTPGMALNEPFPLITKAIGGLHFGSFSDPGFGDFDNDGFLEVVVGNERGGIEFYRTNLRADGTVPVRTPRRPDFSFDIAPNPTSGETVLSGWPVGGVTEIEIFDVAGRSVFRRADVGALSRVRWNGSGAAPGVYVVRLTGSGGSASRRLVVR